MWRQPEVRGQCRPSAEAWGQEEIGSDRQRSSDAGAVALGGHLGRWRWEGPTQSLGQEEAKEEERERGREVSWGMPWEAADP